MPQAHKWSSNPEAVTGPPAVPSPPTRETSSADLCDDALEHVPNLCSIIIIRHPKAAPFPILSNAITPAKQRPHIDDHATLNRDDDARCVWRTCAYPCDCEGFDRPARESATTISCDIGLSRPLRDTFQYGS
jgi:hypothetical protein